MQWQTVGICTRRDTLSDTLQFVVCLGVFNCFQESGGFLKAVEPKAQHGKLKCIGHPLSRRVGILTVLPLQDGRTRLLAHASHRTSLLQRLPLDRV